MANDTIKASSKWLPKMRQLHFNSQQTALVLAVIHEADSKLEGVCTEKAYMLFMSLMGNVIIGNELMDAETMRDAFQECFELFEEINLELLDWEDVVKENEKFADVQIKLEHFGDIEATGSKFCKIGDVKPIKQRVAEIIKRQGEDIDSLEDAAKSIDSPDTLVGVRSYRKMWEMIRDDLIKAKVIEVEK